MLTTASLTIVDNFLPNDDPYHAAKDPAHVLHSHHADMSARFRRCTLRGSGVYRVNTLNGNSRLL